MKKLLTSVSFLAVLAAAPIGFSAAARTDKLDDLSKSEDNWVMQGKNYSSNHYSTLKQINAARMRRKSS